MFDVIFRMACFIFDPSLLCLLITATVLQFQVTADTAFIHYRT